MTTIIARRITERITDEVEIREGDEPGRVIEITESIRRLARRGPQSTKRVGQVPALEVRAK
jgi:hypothetical protein